MTGEIAPQIEVVNTNRLSTCLTGISFGLRAQYFSYSRITTLGVRVMYCPNSVTAPELQPLMEFIAIVWNV